MIGICSTHVTYVSFQKAKVSGEDTQREKEHGNKEREMATVVHMPKKESGGARSVLHNLKQQMYVGPTSRAR